MNGKCHISLVRCVYIAYSVEKRVLATSCDMFVSLNFTTGSNILEVLYACLPSEFQIILSCNFGRSVHCCCNFNTLVQYLFTNLHVAVSMSSRLSELYPNWDLIEFALGFHSFTAGHFLLYAKIWRCFCQQHVL